MTPRERYYWDLTGHLVLRGVLTPDEVDAGNAALDHAAERIENGTDAYSESLRKDSNPKWLNGTWVRTRPDTPFLLMLKSPHCDLWRRLLAHPEIVPRMNAMCGPGFRLDSGPVYIGGVVGTHIHKLHGAGEPHKPYVGYHATSGAGFAGAVTVAYLLTDAGPDDGGFACAPGSHKARYPIPPGVRTTEEDLGCVENPSLKAGDALFFMDGALTHGARPWLAAHPRRTVLYKYACRTAARRGTALTNLEPRMQWDDDVIQGMPAEQRAVMYGPSSSPQTDSPYLQVSDEGVVSVDHAYLPSLKTHSDTFVAG